MFIFFELTCSDRYILEVTDFLFHHRYEILSEFKKLKTVGNYDIAVLGWVPAHVCVVATAGVRDFGELQLPAPVRASELETGLPVGKSVEGK